MYCCVNSYRSSSRCMSESLDRNNMENSNAAALELPLFTCLMDMVALEEGLFCDNRDPRRLRLAQNNLLYGLRLADGSIFKYSFMDGPTVTVDSSQQIETVEGIEKPS